MTKFLALLAICLALPGAALALNCSPYPNTLVNGQIADANQVMADFNTIMNCANTNLAKSGANSDITSLTPSSMSLNGLPLGFNAGANTPVLTLSTAGTSVFTPATQEGRWVCIGGLVTTDFGVAGTLTNGTGTGSVYVGGVVPYTPALTDVMAGSISSLSSTFTGYSGTLSLSGATSTQLRILVNTAGSPTSAIGTTNYTSGASLLVFGTITYRTASGTCS